MNDASITTSDRVGEPGRHPDVGTLHRGVAQEVNPRAVHEGVVPGPREQERAIRKLRREGCRHVPEPGQVRRVEVDHEPVRDEGPVRRRQPFRFHGALDAALELDRLQACAEEARGWSLEEAFEEPLDGGQLRHGRSGV